MNQLPFGVWRLMIAYSLMMAGTPLMILLAGIIGAKIAPSAGLSTFPLALIVAGLAASTLPTGKLLHRFGRRRVFIAYGFIAISAALVALLSLHLASFYGFCLAALMMGWAGAAGHQYRFAALEAVPAELAPKATSYLLLGGILAAFIGPELAVRGRALFATEYAGSFFLLSLSYLTGLVIISFYRDTKMTQAEHHGIGRPFSEILRSRIIILAISAATVGYGIMSLVMTATPISMHTHSGHSLEATKLVIQSHIVAMYLPALAFPWLLGKLGFRGMMWAGVAIYLVCLSIAALNTEFINYWVALVLLGAGWNFLFLSGTNLLPRGYQREERFRVQSMNDFLVFSIQAVVSLSSGWILFHWQWQGIIAASIPLVLGFSFYLWLNRNVTVPVKAVPDT